MVDFQDKFIDEARELVNGLESQLIILESNLNDKIAINEIFRVMHTLKGTASMFGFNSIEQLTHHLETVYDEIRSDEKEVTKEILNVTFETIDLIKLILDRANNLAPDEQDILNETLKKITGLFGNEEDIKKITATDKSEKKPENKLKGFYIFYKPHEDIYFRGIKPFSIFFDINDIGKYKAIPFIDKTPKPEDFDPDKFFLSWDIFLLSESSIEEVKDVFLFYNNDEYYIFELDPRQPDEKSFLPEYSKVTGKALKKGELKKIFKSIEIKENIAFSKSSYIQQSDEVVSKKTALKEIEKKMEGISKKASSIRVSVNKLDDLIINVSEFVTLYSQISLLAKNSENKELNKSIQFLGKLSKKLRDNALDLRLVPVNELSVKMHRLIRDLSNKLDKEINFITEGMETELDKTIIDNLEDPLVHIIRNCIDHGIEDKATRLKLNKPKAGVVRLTAFYSGANVFIQVQDDGKGIDLEVLKQKAIEKGFIHPDAQLSNRELYEIILQPGFSTAEKVSNISGRGVGLDVVKNKINELRGEIEIDSEVGLGTSVTLKLPLTLSIIDTLKVKVENKVYLLPLSAVETCLSVKNKDLVSGIKKQFEFNNDLLPVIMLRDEFGMKSGLPEEGRLVIIKQYEKKYCLLVDLVLGDHQAVVKPLGDLHKNHECFSGVSVMGDGSLALIIDTGKIMNLNKGMYNLN